MWLTERETEILQPLHLSVWVKDPKKDEEKGRGKKDETPKTDENDFSFQLSKQEL